MPIIHNPKKISPSEKKFFPFERLFFHKVGNSGENAQVQVYSGWFSVKIAFDAVMLCHGAGS